MPANGEGDPLQGAAAAGHVDLESLPAAFQELLTSNAQFQNDLNGIEHGLAVQINDLAAKFTAKNIELEGQQQLPEEVDLAGQLDSAGTAGVSAEGGGGLIGLVLVKTRQNLSIKLTLILFIMTDKQNCWTGRML